MGYVIRDGKVYLDTSEEINIDDVIATLTTQIDKINERIPQAQQRLTALQSRRDQAIAIKNQLEGR